jgi:hypothetical protein
MAALHRVYLMINELKIAALAPTSIILNSPSYATAPIARTPFLHEQKQLNTVADCKRNADHALLIIPCALEHYSPPYPGQPSLATRFVQPVPGAVVVNSIPLLQGIELIQRRSTIRGDQ